MEEADAVFRSSRAEISAADASASEAPIAAAAAASLHDGDISSSSSRNSSSSISAVVDTHVSSAPSALPRYLAFGRLLAELPGPSSPSATLALTEHPAPFVTSGSSSNTAPYASSGSSTCAAAPVSSGGSSAANAWRFSAAPFGLPRGISLILADVAGGSETPSMVRKILEWRDRNVDSSGTGAAPPATAAAAAAAAAPPALTSNGNDGSGGTTAGAATAAAGVVDVSDDISVFPKSPAEVWQQLRTANAEVERSLLRLRALYDPTSTSTSSSAGGNGGGTGAPATAGVGDSTPAPLLTLEQYDAQLARAASKRFSEWGTAAEGSNPNATADETKPNAKLGEFAVERALSNVARAFRTARALLRHMGNEAGVPVEPPPQTALADATLNVPGERAREADVVRAHCRGMPRCGVLTWRQPLSRLCHYSAVSVCCAAVCIARRRRGGGRPRCGRLRCAVCSNHRSGRGDPCKLRCTTCTAHSRATVRRLSYCR